MEGTDSLLARLRQRLAEDPRTNILDVEMEVDGDRLHVGGEVDTEQTVQAVLDVLLEALPPGVVLVNRLWTVTYSAPTDSDVEDLV